MSKPTIAVVTDEQLASLLVEIREELEANHHLIRFRTLLIFCAGAATGIVVSSAFQWAIGAACR